MYNLKESKKMLAELYGWKDYGPKHEESVFTKWYQNFYLFEKFGIDKRKAHLASLINSGQMTREEAMELLAERPVYPELGFEQKVLKYPIKTFPNSQWIRNIVVRIYKFIPKEWK